ncbi:MAG: fibronectin type III domain-containing protein [Propionibacteriaceae bacterium]|jgi:hypothetical protein|nr:fibronectin type III domain-containing protein [Propionibacteriaceae bacterium]
MANKTPRSSRLRAVAPYVVVTVVVAVLVSAAIFSRGMDDRVMELNDSGVWVTNGDRGLFGRLNRSAGALDAALSDPLRDAGEATFDVFQDGESVVGWTRSQSRLSAIDPRSVEMTGDGPVAVGPLSAVAMGGGILATISSDKGEIRAVSYAPDEIPDLTGLAVDQPAVATLNVLSGLDRGVAIAVDAAGVVVAASASGDTVRIDRDGTVTPGSLGAQLAAVEVTIVGGEMVCADPISGAVFLPSGARHELGADRSLALEQPEANADRVIVAATSGLWSIPLRGGDPTRLDKVDGASSSGTSESGMPQAGASQSGTAGDGTPGDGTTDSTDSADSIVWGAPARPVVVASTTYAAWAGTPGRVVKITDSRVSQLSFPTDGTALISPAFRVNKGSVVLNDMATGTVFDIIDEQSMDQWDTVDPQDEGTTGDPQRSQEATPNARPDHLWARPGRTAILHVLDNDENPGGGIMAITTVTGTDAARIRISPDGQSLVAEVPAGQASDMTVSYSVTNRSVDDEGSESVSSADVTLSMREPGQNTAPNLVGELGVSLDAPDHTVASGGSVSIAAGWAWRDADSDPVTVVAAEVDSAPVVVSSEGVIVYHAPVVDIDTTVTINYQVGDGSGQTSPGVVYVKVLAANATLGVAPQAMSDLVRAVVDRPVVFFPVANDIPGCDPLDRQAVLALAAPISERVGLQVSTDIVTGAVTVTAARVGSYFLDYTVSFGSGFATGKIRVDVGDQTSLIAMPDTALVHGTVAATVDVLSNDHDSAGSVLTVTSATPVNPDRIQVVVVEGRWLRVRMLSSAVLAAQAQVTYAVSNGLGQQATGVVDVTQTVAPSVDRVSVVDDYARVRVGDVTTIPVLRNDSSQSGEALVLNDNVTGLLAGQLTVEDPTAPLAQAKLDVGQAFVDGSFIRYQAPLGGDQQRRLRIEYQAQSPSGSPTTGHVWVDVVPLPATAQTDSTGQDATLAAGDNAAPTPAAIEVRTIVGDTVDVPIGVYGQDPDGDSVTVVGLRTPPKFGRVTSVGADVLTYESYPDMGDSGSDTFQYYVQDRFGAVGIGTVRVGVAPVGTATASLAVDDVVTAQPGAGVNVYPMTNDIIPLGSGRVDIASDDQSAKVSLDQEHHLLQTTAPGLGEAAATTKYHLEADGVAGVSAQVSIRSQPGYVNPPNVYDHVATSVVDGVASAQVLDDAWDVDGPSGAITIVSVGAPGTFDGSTVSVPVTDRGQVIPFVVADADGAQAMAVVFVPSLKSGRPELVSGGLITMDANSSLTVDLNDYITSPRDQPVVLTMASQAWTAPEVNLGLMVESDRKITLQARNDYSGPAALTVEVRDSPDATDPDALVGVVTIPVQVGKATPVLWCPSAPQEVVQGGMARTLDIARLCHAWMPTEDAIAELRFSAEWATGGDEVTISGADGAALPSSMVQIKAGPGSIPGQSSVLTIHVDGYPDVTGEVTVAVIAAPAPTLAVASVTDVVQGSVVRIPVTVVSPMADATQNIVRVTQTQSTLAGISFDDDMITITPGPTSHGEMVFDVVASDVSDDSRTDRQVTGHFSVTVVGAPDPPSAPRADMQLRSQSAVISFVPGADNGAPITSYEVRWDGGSYSCGVNTTCEIPGLTNGTAYQFQVKAVNKVGESEWSPPSAPVIPDAPPGLVLGAKLTAVSCGSVTVTWSGTSGSGTVESYALSFSATQPGVGTTVSVGADQRTYTVPVASTVAVSGKVSIVAVNGHGQSNSAATVNFQTSCVPLWPQDSAITARAQDMGDTAQVAVTWPVADPQGPGPVTYHVTRSGPDGTKTFPPTTETTLGDNGVAYDGATYTYAVTATNASGGAAHTSEELSSSWKAVGAPAPWSSLGGAEFFVGAATGVDGQIRVSMNRFPDFRDSSGEVIVRLFGGDEVARLRPGQSSALINGLTNGEAVDLTLSACNSADACNAPIQFSVTDPGPSGVAGGVGPYGPLQAPSLTQAGGQGQEVCVTASGNGNGRASKIEVDYQIVTAQGNGGSGSGVTPTGPTGSQGWDPYCVDVGAWDTEVKFTAYVTDIDTDPNRPSSPSATLRLRSAVGVPDDFAQNAVNIEATGDNGVAQLIVDPFPRSNGGDLKVYYQVGSGEPHQTNGTGPNRITGLTNGESTTVKVWADNGTHTNTPVEVSVTTYGPMSGGFTSTSPAAGTLSVDKTQCASFTADTNGVSVRWHVLVEWDAIGSSPPTTEDIAAVGHIEETVCVDSGQANVTAKFTLYVIPLSGPVSNRIYEEISVKSAATPPPTITFNTSRGTATDKTVCVAATLTSPDFESIDVTFKMTNSVNDEWVQGTEDQTYDLCVDAGGPSVAVTFTATAVGETFMEDLPDVTEQITVTSMPDPEPILGVRSTAEVNDKTCQGCHAVVFELSRIRGPWSCSASTVGTRPDDSGATPDWSATWDFDKGSDQLYNITLQGGDWQRLGGMGSGLMSQTGAQNGYFFDGDWTVSCASDDGRTTATAKGVGTDL